MELISWFFRRLIICWCGWSCFYTAIASRTYLASSWSLRNSNRCLPIILSNIPNLDSIIFPFQNRIKLTCFLSLFNISIITWSILTIRWLRWPCDFLFNHGRIMRWRRLGDSQLCWKRRRQTCSLIKWRPRSIRKLILNRCWLLRHCWVRSWSESRIVRCLKLCHINSPWRIKLFI